MTLLKWIWRIIVLACALGLLGVVLTLWLPVFWASVIAGLFGVLILGLIAVKHSRVRHLDRLAESAEVVDGVLEVASDGVVEVASAVIESVD